jgi:elongation factor Ts
MSNFTVADVKRLRELTAAGMMDCKNALQEADGNFDRAVEILRIKGAKDVGKRAERTASNGLVTVALDGTTTGALLELNCETDFVAKTEAFQVLAFQVTEFAVQNKPSDVPSLLAAEIVPGTTVQQLLDEANATLGEKIEIRRFALLEAPYLATYLHKSDPSLPPSTGVLLALSTTDAEVGKDVTHQIAAMAPKYLSKEEVPADLVADERRIAEETARAEGKPEQAISKIVDGRVASFFKDVALLEQPFVKDNKRTIKQVLADAGVEVRGFARFKVGQ